MDWFAILGILFSGGLIVKVVEVLYKEYRHKKDEGKTSTNLLNKYMDPILKAADELVGKLRFLAQSDFRELARHQVPSDSQFDLWLPYLNLLYLFAQFWCRVEMLRIEGLFVNLGSDKRGKQLFAFIRQLEGTRTRLIERSWQRAIGEALIVESTGYIRALRYEEFVGKFLSSEDFRRWFLPLAKTLSRLNHKGARQRLLGYGVILHALIDTLDSKHLVARDRPGWPNKLTSRTKRELRFRVFRQYLKFVKEPERYLSQKYEPPARFWHTPVLGRAAHLLGGCSPIKRLTKGLMK
jgi:hypothetical protein